MTHQTYDTMYAHQTLQEEQIITQLRVIIKAVSIFQGSLPRPRSSPNYEEVEAECPNFSYFKILSHLLPYL